MSDTCEACMSRAQERGELARRQNEPHGSGVRAVATIAMRWLVAVVAFACLSGCTHNAPGPGDVSQANANSAMQNKEIARHLIRTEYSQWNDEEQFQCLDKLWHAESRWNHHARNQRTGACGIPQSFPCHKMASFGRQYGVDHRRNPWPQVAWGLQYIDQRYGSPCAAWKRFKRGGGY